MSPSAEPQVEHDYVSKVFSTLKENVDGFSFANDESGFRKKLQSDSDYASRVHATLKDDIEGFSFADNPTGFYKEVGLKKKSDSSVSSPTTATPSASVAQSTESSTPNPVSEMGKEQPSGFALDMKALKEQKPFASAAPTPEESQLKTAISDALIKHNPKALNDLGIETNKLKDLKLPQQVGDKVESVALNPPDINDDLLSSPNYVKGLTEQIATKYPQYAKDIEGYVQGLNEQKSNVRQSMKQIAVKPNDPNGYYDLASAKLQTGDLDEAQKGFMASLSVAQKAAQDPNITPEKFDEIKRSGLKSLQGLGFVAMKQGDYKSAVDLYGQVAQVNPTPDVLSNLSYSLYQTGDIEGAGLVIQNAIHKNPNEASPNALRVRGIINTAAGLTEAGLADTKQSAINYAMQQELPHVGESEHEQDLAARGAALSAFVDKAHEMIQSVARAAAPEVAIGYAIAEGIEGTIDGFEAIPKSYEEGGAPAAIATGLATGVRAAMVGMTAFNPEMQKFVSAMAKAEAVLPSELLQPIMQPASMAMDITANSTHLEKSVAEIGDLIGSILIFESAKGVGKLGYKEAVRLKEKISNNEPLSKDEATEIVNAYQAVSPETLQAIDKNIAENGIIDISEESVKQYTAKAPLQKIEPVEPSQVVELNPENTTPAPQGEPAAIDPATQVEGEVQNGEAQNKSEVPNVSEAGKAVAEPAASDRFKGKELSILRNPEKAPNMGERFNQHLEPTGKYVIEQDASGFKPEGWQESKVNFDNPLIVETDGSPKWKKDLSEKNGGLTGKKLSDKLIKDGYDGIITVHADGGTGEIVILDKTKESKNEPPPISKDNAGLPTSEQGPPESGKDKEAETAALKSFDRYDMRDHVEEELKNSNDFNYTLRNILTKIFGGKDRFTATGYGSEYGDYGNNKIRIGDHKGKEDFKGIDIRTTDDAEATAENFVQELYDGQGKPLLWNRETPVAVKGKAESGKKEEGVEKATIEQSKQDGTNKKSADTQTVSGSSESENLTPKSESVEGEAKQGEVGGKKTTKEKLAEAKAELSAAIRKSRAKGNVGINNVKGVFAGFPEMLKVAKLHIQDMVEEGVLSFKEFVKRIREDLADTDFEKATDEDIQSLYDEANKVEIKHKATEELRETVGLEEYERATPQTHAEWDAEASRQIKEGYNIEKLINKINEGHDPTPVETKILEKYIATAKAKFNDAPTDENLNELKRIVDVADVAGTRAGQNLVARRSVAEGGQTPDATLADYFLHELTLNNDAPLTDNQKATITKEYEDISAAKKALEEHIKKLEDENAKLKAEAEIKSSKRNGTTKKTHDDFVAERKKITESISEKLAKIRANPQSIVVPYARELVAVAPDVAKMVKSYVEEGVSKLDDIATKIHDDLKGHIPDITKQDVIDVIAGNYNETKQTRNDIAAQLVTLRQQANLLSKLDALEQGKEPSSEFSKRKKIQQVEDLKKQIKEHDLTKLADYKKRVKLQIEKLETDLKNNNIAPVIKPKQLVLDKDGKALKDKYIKLKQEREIRQMREQYENRNRYEKTRDRILEVLNVPRTLMSSMDFSAPLRQGLIASIANPKIALGAAREMFSHAFSQKAFDRWFHDVRDDPRFNMSHEAGLYIADPHDPRLSAKEEMFMNNLAEKIPVVGKFVKGSERAYVTYLNKIRWDIFNRFADLYESQGKTIDNSSVLYKELAHYINNSTGRGKLGSAESAAPVLSTLVFAPRLIASRVNMLTNWANPQFYNKVPREIRSLYFKDMAKFIGVGLTALAIAKLNGADVEDDPRSSDFGKIKYGDTRYDVWGGHVQYIRVLTQMLTGQSKSTQTGKINDFDEGNALFGANRADVLLRFLRGKLAPVPSMAADVLAQRTITGEKVTLGLEAKQHLLPLLYNDVETAIKDNGVKSVFTVGVPSMFGVGVQTFGGKVNKYLMPEKTTQQFLEKNDIRLFRFKTTKDENGVEGTTIQGVHVPLNDDQVKAVDKEMEKIITKEIEDRMNKESEVQQISWNKDQTDYEVTTSDAKMQKLNGLTGDNLKDAINEIKNRAKENALVKLGIANVKVISALQEEKDKKASQKQLELENNNK